MLGGTKITDTTRSHAAEMLLSAGEADGADQSPMHPTL
jgi:DNA repair protein RecN (Recombination protein N)